MTTRSEDARRADASEDWLAVDYSEPGTVVAWCEAHAGLILLSANLVLWGSVACGFHFG